MKKYYICPHCKEVNTREEWDRATKEVFNDTDLSICETPKGYVCVCPSCRKKSEIGFAEVTNLNFTLGELLLIYNGLKKLPKDMIFPSGNMKSGAKYETVNTKELIEKVKNYGEELENSLIGKY